jgi:polyisoprenoid-binding protein YceI
MHGITKTIVLDALCRMGMNPKSNQPIAGFKITGTIKRSDYAIGTSMADNMISNEVIVIANAEFDKK